MAMLERHRHTNDSFVDGGFSSHRLSRCVGRLRGATLFVEPFPCRIVSASPYVLRAESSFLAACQTITTGTVSNSGCIRSSSSHPTTPIFACWVQRPAGLHTCCPELCSLPYRLFATVTIFAVPCLSRDSFLVSRPPRDSQLEYPY